MWTPAHAYLPANSFVHTENVFRSALQNAGKRSDLSSKTSSALSLFNTEQRRPALATLCNNNADFFLDQSTQHFEIGPYKTTFRKHRSNIGSRIYVACLTATFVLFPLPPSRPIEFASCSQFKNFSVPDYRDNQCNETILHAIRINKLLELCKRAALYRTFISQSFVRGNNSKDPVAGRVSGVVVDEGGHAVCLPSVT